MCRRIQLCRMQISAELSCRDRNNDKPSLTAHVRDDRRNGRAGPRLHAFKSRSEPQPHDRSRHWKPNSVSLSLNTSASVGLRLTSHGEDLLQRSRQLLTLSELLTEHAQALRGGQTGTLKVGATPQVIANLIAPFLPGHRRDHPGVDVQLLEGGDPQQRTRLEQGEVHLTIMPVSGGGFMSYQLLAPVHAMAVMLKTHPLARRKVIEVEELTKHPLLLLQRGYGSRAWFDAECESAQVRPLVLMESTTAHTLTELAAVGHGIAVVPSTSAVRDPVRAIPIVNRGTSVGRWVGDLLESTTCFAILRETVHQRVVSLTPSARSPGARTSSRLLPCRSRASP